MVSLRPFRKVTATLWAIRGNFSVARLCRSLRRRDAAHEPTIANAANTSALIYQMLPDLNWAGFYMMQGDRELVLGPFQGKPACVRIPVGHGVCGSAVERHTSILVKDVHAFPGHIACDAASRSELVVPVRPCGQGRRCDRSR
jgi:GAF domain-containing protein